MLFRSKDGRNKYDYIITLIEKFKKTLKFYSSMKQAYSNKRRNSEVYAQYVFVQQDGVLFFNIKEQGGKQQEVLFEE